MKDVPTIEEFQQLILKWYEENGRILPWRTTSSPYHILISEIMLQQTQVSRVIQKYNDFIKKFPDFSTLASSSTKDLLSIWQGLGYWRRAKYLQELAKQVITKYNGKLPKNIEVLETFPGIGPYTSRAIACFAFGNNEPFIDTNIRRVYIHFFFPKETKVTDKSILTIAKKAVLKESPKTWHYALFDYGSQILRKTSVNKRSTTYHNQSKFEKSFRFYRTKAINIVMDSSNSRILQKTLIYELEKIFEKDSVSFQAKSIIDSLIHDRLFQLQKNMISI